MTTELTQEATDELRGELLEQRQDLIRRLGKIGEHLIPDEALEADWQEQAQQLENHEVLGALDESSRRELDQINSALARMQSGDYGECVECGDEIGVKRLKAIPYALRCIRCESNRS